MENISHIYKNMFRNQFSESTIADLCIKKYVLYRYMGFRTFISGTISKRNLTK